MCWLLVAGVLEGKSQQQTALSPPSDLQLEGFHPVRLQAEGRMDVCELQPGWLALIIPHIPGWPRSREGHPESPQ